MWVRVHSRASAADKAASGTGTSLAHRRGQVHLHWETIASAQATLVTAVAAAVDDDAGDGG